MSGAFITGARVSYQSLPETRTAITIVVRLLIVPLFTALFYLVLATGGTGTLRPEDALAASLSVGAIQTTVALCGLIATDRFEATSTFFFIAPTGSLALWLGRFAVPAAIGFITGIVASVSMLLVSGAEITFSEWLYVPMVVLAAVVGSVGLGYFLAAFSLGLQDPLLTANLAGYVIPLVSGTIAPLSLFPGWAQVVCGLLPLSHVTTASRTLMLPGHTTEVWTELGISIALGMLWVLAGRIVWRIHEWKIPRHGGIDD